jgi:hypothetical protein
VVYEPSYSVFNFSTIGTRLVCLCVKSLMQYAFFNNLYLDPCVSVRISGENPRSVRKCPVCPIFRTPDTHGQLAAVPLIILVFGWRCCDDYSPRKSILGTRTRSRCSIAGVLLYATFNDFGAKCKKCYFNNQKRLWRHFLEKKTRGASESVQTVRDFGHRTYMNRRAPSR